MKSWVKKKLIEVCKIGDGNHSSNYPKKDEIVPQGIPFIRANNLVNGNVSWKDMKFITKEKHAILKKGHLKSGDILFTNRGEIGKIAIVGRDFENANLNSQIAWFRCLEKLENKFLYYFLLSPSMQNYYLVEKNGAALQQFTIKQINDIEISVPTLPEQQRIVSILDEAFDKISIAKSNAEQNLKNARELFESYLLGMFENKGEGWEEYKLDEITEVKDGTHDSPKYIKEGIPFVTQKNIKLDGLSFDDTKFITKTDHEKFYKRSNVSYGDILISMIGANRGMAAIVDDKRTFSIKNVGLIKSSEEINMNYLLYYLKSSLAIKYVLYMSNGGAQEFIGLTALRSFPIPCPSLKEQNEIVNKLDALSAETKKLESIYQQKIKDLEELKKSVLQKAFSGELNT